MLERLRKNARPRFGAPPARTPEGTGRCLGVINAKTGKVTWTPAGCNWPKGQESLDENDFLLFLGPGSHKVAFRPDIRLGTSRAWTGRRLYA